MNVWMVTGKTPTGVHTRVYCDGVEFEGVYVANAKANTSGGFDVHVESFDGRMNVDFVADEVTHLDTRTGKTTRGAP